MKKIVLFIVIFCLPFSGFSQTESTSTETNESWEFNVTPYLWMTGLSGEMTVLNKDVPVDLNFKGDILSNLKMAAMVHAEAKKGRFSIMLDVFYAKLGADGTLKAETITERNVRVRLKQNMFEGGIGYTFAKAGGFSLDALAGARFFDVNTNTELNDVALSSRDFNFIEPYVGMRFQNYWEKWAVGGRIDAGGFGVGSEISYKYNLFVGYQFSELFDLNLGYQSYKPNYVDDLFTYNIASEGFLLGFNFKF